MHTTTLHGALPGPVTPEVDLKALSAPLRFQSATTKPLRPVQPLDAHTAIARNELPQAMSRLRRATSHLSTAMEQRNQTKGAA